MRRSMRTAFIKPNWGLFALVARRSAACEAFLFRHGERNGVRSLHLVTRRDTVGNARRSVPYCSNLNPYGRALQNDVSD